MIEHSRGRGGHHPGANPKPTSSVADKKLRAAFAAKCAELAPEIFQFKVDIFRNEALDHGTRDAAANWLIDRAFGRVTTPVEATGGTTDLIKHIYEVRWLPPEAPDHTKTIEAEASEGGDGDAVE